jgi:hypothetical protein
VTRDGFQVPRKSAFNRVDPLGFTHPNAVCDIVIDSFSVRARDSICERTSRKEATNGGAFECPISSIYTKHDQSE